MGDEKHTAQKVLLISVGNRAHFGGLPPTLSFSWRVIEKEELSGDTIVLLSRHFGGVVTSERLCGSISICTL